MLGVCIDDDINFNSHINNVCENKTSKPTRSVPDGPHVGPTNLAIGEVNALLACDPKKQNGCIPKLRSGKYCHIAWFFTSRSNICKLEKNPGKCLSICIERFYIMLWLTHIKSNNIWKMTAYVFNEKKNLIRPGHYNDVIVGAIASQITSLTIVYSTVYSDADQRKHQSSASLAFVRGIHRGPVNSPHIWPVTRKMFPFDDVIMLFWTLFPMHQTSPWFTGL